MPVVALHPVAGNLDYVESCLRQTNLPTQDLQTTPAEFYYATAVGERLGVGVPSRFQSVASCHGVSDAGMTGFYPIDDRAFQST
jgi:hypothetical protein